MFAAISEAGYECFLQVASVLYYKMDAKNTAYKSLIFSHFYFFQDIYIYPRENLDNTTFI
jgi:hypothetical protein